MIDMSAGDVRLEPAAQVRLFGKGRKMRAVPLMDATAQLLRDHLRENGLDRPERFEDALFQNRQGARLTRWGVRYILDKHVRAARNAHPGFTQPVTPHTLRHSKGMHLLQSGVSLEIIRDFLGHAHVLTTQIYARANLEMKRKALARMPEDSTFPDIPSWKKDRSLLDCWSGFVRCDIAVATRDAEQSRPSGSSRVLFGVPQGQAHCSQRLESATPHKSSLTSKRLPLS